MRVLEVNRTDCLLKRPKCDVKGGVTKNNCLICILGALEEIHIAEMKLISGTIMVFTDALRLEQYFRTFHLVLTELLPAWAKVFDHDIAVMLDELKKKADEESKKAIHSLMQQITGDGKTQYLG